MKLDDTINRIEQALGGLVFNSELKSDRRAYIDIEPASVMQANSLMFGELGARFQIATGVDTREGIEVMYHWAFDHADFLVTLRTLLDHEAPQLASIAPMCPAAEWIEREMWELLGIEFLGHPDLRHLLLSDDWPEDNYPLRRSHPAGNDEVAP
ncbi:MAG: NADH-quinone oxidoreductase subunit C [Thiogranum sp.]